MNWVNSYQTKEERQFKYAISRLYFNHANSRQQRDFTYGHLAQRLNTKIIKGDLI